MEEKYCNNCKIGDGSPYPCAIYNAMTSLLDFSDIPSLPPSPNQFYCSLHTLRD